MAWHAGAVLPTVILWEFSGGSVAGMCGLPEIHQELLARMSREFSGHSGRGFYFLF